MVKVNAAFHFNGSGYIGKPYWPELDAVIKIEREIHPKLGPAKKEAALLAACEKFSITRQRYDELKELSKRPFYTIDGTRGGEIVIPQRVFQSFLNHASMEAPKSVPKIQEKGLTFIGVRIDGGFLKTGKTEKDAKSFDRFVKNDDSNQRQWNSDLYIDDFTARGVLQVDENVIKCDALLKLTEYGAQWFGIGSARQQGFGRFSVITWEKI